MIGILTEKPSAGRDFAKALGGMSGTYQGEAYVIVSLRGHLFEFKEPAAQVDKALAPRYKNWSVQNLPWSEGEMQWKREKKKDTAALLKQLKTTLSKVDEIVIAGDLDESGEGAMIDLEVIEELKLRPKKFSRMYFTDQSVKSLQAAFTSRKTVPNLYQHDECMKAMFRQKWDFMSQQWTRIATACGDGRAVLRQGRLKSAMVLLVGDQLDKLGKYKKVPFYTNKFRDDHGVVYTSKEEPSFPTKAEVPQVYHGSGVTEDGRTMKRTAPPKLLDLAGLSGILAGKGCKPKEVLETYQKMYEYSTPLRKDNKGSNVGGIVSYPRTDDKTITPEQFNDLLPYVDMICQVVGVDSATVTHRTPRGTHVKPEGAHGANRPGLNVPNSLDELKQFGPSAVLIYETLARNYLAMLCEDYEYESQKGHVTDWPSFTGTASVPKVQGWKAVFQDQDEEDQEDNALGLGSKAEPFIHEGFPPKPETPTIRWLTKRLEGVNVGTGATRTSTISQVTDERAKYPLMKESRGKLTLTEFGQMSYRLLPGTYIGDLKITERVQEQMKQIADGKLEAGACLHEIQKMIREDIQVMQANGEKMRKELNVAMSAGYGDKEYATGSWNGKDVRFNRVFRGHRFTDQEVADLLAGKEIAITGLIAKSGSTYGVYGALANLEFNGRPYVGVEQRGFVQDNGVPKSWCGHTFTEEEKTALESGCKIEVSDCVSKKTGKTFSCTLHWGEREDGTEGLVPEFG